MPPAQTATLRKDAIGTRLAYLRWDLRVAVWCHSNVFPPTNREQRQFPFEGALL
jgi:hypothetical protein